MAVTAIWVLAIALMLVGLAGIVVPVLPGVPLMFAGMLLVAWQDDFARIGPVSLAVLGGLTLLTVIVDVAASALGAKKVGAGSRAILGALLGTVVGLFFGIAGLILGPFLGAVIGELSAPGRLDQALRVGVATWWGFVLGTLVKLGIAFAMLGVFIAAYFID